MKVEQMGRVHGAKDKGSWHDTLWSIGSTIQRAEQVLATWLSAWAPGAAALEAGMQTVRVSRQQHVWFHAAQPHHRVENLTELVALLE